MEIFYSNDIHENIATLKGDEVHHIRVLRYKVGQDVILMDGMGNKIEGEILSLSKKSASISIKSIKAMNAPHREFSLCIAPTKNINRIEWCVEKAVEFGIQGIYFFPSAHSERQHIRIDRIIKKTISAAKQSYKWYHPVVHEMDRYENIIQKPYFKNHVKLIAHLSDKAENILPIIRSTADKPLTVMIGPEGDFNEKELTMAEQAGWQQVSLGKARLRTETAALYVASLNYNLQEQ